MSFSFSPPTPPRFSDSSSSASHILPVHSLPPSSTSPPINFQTFSNSMDVADPSTGHQTQPFKPSSLPSFSSTITFSKSLSSKKYDQEMLLIASPRDSVLLQDRTTDDDVDDVDQSEEERPLGHNQYDSTDIYRAQL